MTGKSRKVCVIALDIFLINFAFMTTLLLRFEGMIPMKYSMLYKKNILVLTVIFLTVFYIWGLYKSLWCYASTREIVQIVGAGLTGTMVFAFWGIISKNMFPKSVYVLNIFLLLAGVTGSRLGYRLLRRGVRLLEKKKIIAYSCTKVKRIMLVGAGEAGALIIKDLKLSNESDGEIILCVDDHKNKQGLSIKGVPIKGTTKDIKTLARDYKIDEIIIAIPSASKKRTSDIIKLCQETQCQLKIFPGINEVLDLPSKGKVMVRDVKIEDLLGREEIILKNTKVEKIIKDKTILVTGGGGSIGSELCRQILKFSPKLLLIFDIYENNAYDLQMELVQSGVPSEKIKMLIGSVRDKNKLNEVFSTYKPEMVFHAAAHKHVPLMEYNPAEAIKNNVFGTYNVAQCARKFEAERFVLVSTDKAVNPTNVMGASKRMCEMIVQAINKVSEHTEFVAVRFGNVLGSNGSVIPLFKKQLLAGGPLTVTHPDIIRYFMTIPEAVRLILEANSFAKGGEIFVLDMGEPVKIHDLAKNFIRLSGLEEGKDIEIKFTGLRPGEKLYEELLMAEENLGETESDKIFIGQPSEISYSEVQQKLQRLKKAIDEGEDLRKVLMEVVPTYHLEDYNQKIV